jgi:cytochrome c-type biogenesis protein CcmE
MRIGTKLIVGAAIIAGTTAYMAYLGASASWQYYVTAEECLASSDSLVGSRLRVSGRIAPGSLKIAPDRRGAEFALEVPDGRLRVVCDGPLPDNLAEGIDVVVECRMEERNLLRGTKVLTRCASKYESKSPNEAEARSGGAS